MEVARRELENQAAELDRLEREERERARARRERKLRRVLGSDLPVLLPLPFYAELRIRMLMGSTQISTLSG